MFTLTLTEGSSFRPWIDSMISEAQSKQEQSRKVDEESGTRVRTLLNVLILPGKDLPLTAMLWWTAHMFLALVQHRVVARSGNQRWTTSQRHDVE